MSQETKPRNPKSRSRQIWLVALVFAVVGVAVTLLHGTFPASEPPSQGGTEARGLASNSIGHKTNARTALDDVETDQRPAQSGTEIERATLAKRHFGVHWRRFLEIGTRIDQHLDKAGRGDANSILEILDVLQDCGGVENLESDAQVEELFRHTPQSSHAESMIEALVFLLDDCPTIWRRMPSEHSTSWEWRQALVDRAASSGNAIAKLMQINRELLQVDPNLKMRGQNTPPTGSDLQEISELLNAALRTNDHRAYGQARMLFEFYDDREHGLHVDFWNQAICSRDPRCDLEVYEDSATHLFTHELETINDAIQRFERRLDDPTPIRFQNMLLDPLQMPNGLMWFEQTGG